MPYDILADDTAADIRMNHADSSLILTAAFAALRS